MGAQKLIGGGKGLSCYCGVDRRVSDDTEDDSDSKIKKGRDERPSNWSTIETCTALHTVLLEEGCCH